MVSSERIEWIHISFISRPSTLPCWISAVTKAMARISRISDELKLSSLTRFRISAAEVGTLGRDDVLEVARSGDRPDAEAVLLPDTALHTIAWLDDLERALGKPVLTANQVTIWQGLRLVGHPAGVLDPLRAFGIG